jgi:hypothetical protein
MCSGRIWSMLTELPAELGPLNTPKTASRSVVPATMPATCRFFFTFRVNFVAIACAPRRCANSGTRG